LARWCCAGRCWGSRQVKRLGAEMLGEGVDAVLRRYGASWTWTRTLRRCWQGLSPGHASDRRLAPERKGKYLAKGNAHVRSRARSQKARFPIARGPTGTMRLPVSSRSGHGRPCSGHAVWASMGLGTLTVTDILPRRDRRRPKDVPTQRPVKGHGPPSTNITAVCPFPIRGVDLGQRLEFINFPPARMV